MALSSRTTGRLLAVASLGVIAALTLRPGAQIYRCSPWALFCGEFRGADFVLNVLVFVPFGVGLGLALKRGTLAYLIPAAVGAAIELAQSTPWISRDPALRDVIANGLGGAAGVWIGTNWHALLRPTDREARRWHWVWSAATSAMLIFGGLMLEPSLPPTRWFGQWTAELGQYDQFNGRLLDARLGEEFLISGPLARTDEVRREAKRTGYALGFRAEVGPGAPSRVAPALSVFDDGPRQLALIGQWRQDLVFNARVKAQDHGFHPIWFRAPGVFGHLPEEIEVEGRVLDGRFSAEWRSLQGGGDTRASIGPADIWRALLPVELVLPWPVSMLSTGLLAMMMIPLGYYGSDGGKLRPRAAAALLPAALALVPIPFALAVAPIAQWAAAAGGFLAGATLRRGTWKRENEIA